jgi:hypothetical protein
MIHDYIRCPGCGHVHQVKDERAVLPPQISEHHEFQVLVKRTGRDAGGKRIDWGSRSITVAEVRALYEVFDGITTRLKARLEETE